MRAAERLRHSRRVEPLRLAPAPRQRQHLPRPRRRIVERPLFGRDHLTQVRPERLADRARQVDPVERPEHLVDPRTRRGRCARGVGRLAGRLGRRGGERLVRAHGPVGAVTKQSERVGLVHHPRAAEGRQVEQVPPLALRRRGDHVGRVCRPPFRRAAGQGSRTAESLERLVVLVPAWRDRRAARRRRRSPRAASCASCEVLLHGAAVRLSRAGTIAPASYRRGRRIGGQHGDRERHAGPDDRTVQMDRPPPNVASSSYPAGASRPRYVRSSSHPSVSVSPSCCLDLVPSW